MNLQMIKNAENIYKIQYIDYLNLEITTINDNFSGDYFMYTPINTPWNIHLINKNYFVN